MNVKIKVTTNEQGSNVETKWGDADWGVLSRFKRPKDIDENEASIIAENKAIVFLFHELQNLEAMGHKFEVIPKID